MKTAEIRKKFLDYFERQGHSIEPSSSLIPQNDKTLLFTNSGMVPFKDVFSGAEKRPYKRAASCQRCVRAGGKHNDLENVGYTARHHTFFEMLGNFSFGDYFKKDAIRFAWEFLTNEINLPPERLWVSVFEDDDEAEDIWVNEIGFPKNRISRCGAKDNFWQMGDTGPCGPCSEIFYDHGESIPGGPPGHADEDGDRYIEIWNLVFTQFDKQEDGYLKPLDAPCVDTGMGLERLAAVLQHVNNNYDTDGFQELTKEITKLSDSKLNLDQADPSVRVIADHIRSTAFMITDGVPPSNEGRGYVLRRIIRRAIRHGHKIGINKVFFYRLAPILALQMNEIYPELKKNLANVEKVLKKEEDRFLETLDQGMNILEESISKLTSSVIDGKTVFKLYDTFGFPVDLTADVAREKGLSLDMEGFDLEMEKQRQRARVSGDFTNQKTLSIDFETNFVGYDQLESNSSVIAMTKNGQQVNELTEGDQAVIFLENTPFYGESGGQIGDSGELIFDDGVFEVLDTQKQVSGAYEHYGKVISGLIRMDDPVNAKVDSSKRKKIARNHSATHLLHAALRKVLGETVSQKGSLVDSDRLRFDFSHDEPLSDDEINEVESMVNRKILGNTEVHSQLTDLDHAKKLGAMALFGEKYGESVRVLTMGKGDFSVELCGGTHVERLGDIGLFKIVNETGIASGIRRIEAITGFTAYEFDKNKESQINQISDLVRSDPSKVVDKILQILEQQKKLEKQISIFQKQLAGNQSDDLLKDVKEINGIKLLSAKIEDVEIKDLRDIVDKIKHKLTKAVVILALVKDNKISLVSGVSKNLTDVYHAGEILKYVALQIDGKGGGRPDMAQGGGTNISNLDKALESVEHLIN
jgi:alanyl-tRNA synthetase